PGGSQTHDWPGVSAAETGESIEKALDVAYKSATVLAEFRLPLFPKRVRAPQPLCGPEEETEGAEAELADAGQVLRVGVEGLLRELERRGTLLEQLPAPALGLRAQLGNGDDRVHESHGEGFCRAVLAAQIPEFPGFFLAHDPREVGRPEAGVDASDPWSGLPEDRVVAADREIAEDLQHVPSTDCESAHHGDHGLGDGADDPVETVHVHAQASAPIAARATLAL